MVLQVLIADFFFVCLSLVALLVAIGVQLVSKSTVRMRQLEAWHITIFNAYDMLGCASLTV